jgi:hypothetical protein
MSKRSSRSVVCQVCAGDFFPLVGRHRKNLYCSTTCRDEARTTRHLPLSETEIAWLAGIFDGEGNVAVRAPLSQRAFGVIIQITNTNFEMLTAVKKRTGVGSIYQRPVKDSDPLHWKIRYDWRTSGRNAKSLLALMQPWLIEKRAKCEEALRTAATRT